MRRRPLPLSVAVLAALGALVSVVMLAPTPLHEPGESAAAVPSSQLVQKYPLGERPLCCGPEATARDAASPRTALPVPGGDPAAGGRGLELLAFLCALTLAAALGSFVHRFTRVDGAWVRGRQRRRLLVGPTLYRWARSSGFRYSPRREALVLRALGGRFGPVLTLRSDGPAPPRPQPAERAPLHATARRPFPSSPACTVDVAFRVLPHQHRGAQLWQLTAVDVRSQFVWADLVRRRSGPPAAPELAAFLRRVAADLDDAGEQLDAVAAPVRILPVLDDVALPAGVRLVVAEAAGPPSGTADDVHELFVARHWRTAFTPPAAPPLEELRRRLQIWIASYNAQHEETPSRHVWLLSLR